MRNIILILIVLMLTVLATLTAVVYTDTGTGLALRYARQLLPDYLELGEVNGRLAGPLHIERLRYQRDRLTAEALDIQIRWRWWELLDERLTVDAVEAAAVTIRTAEPDPASVEQAVSDRPFSMLSQLPDLPIDIVVHRLQVSRIEYQRGLDNVISPVALSLAAQWIGTRLEVSNLLAQSAQFRIQGALRTNAQSVGGDLTFGIPLASPYPQLFGALAVAGTLAAPEFRLTTNAPYQAETEGTADLRASPTITLRSHGNVEVSELFETQHSAPLRFNLSMSADAKTIQLEQLDITHTAAGTKLTAGGELHLGERSEGAFSAQWTQLRWPPVPNAPWQSPSGVIDISGSYADGALDYNATVDAAVIAGKQGDPLAEPQPGRAQFVASARDNRHRITGTLTAFNTAPLAPAWPAVLNADVDVDIDTSSNTPLVHIRKSVVDGKLKDADVRITATGDFSDTASINATFAVSALNALHARLSGGAEGTLALLGDRSNPSIDLTVHADALAVDAGLPLHAERAVFTLKGTPASHRAEYRATPTDTPAHIAWQGTLDDIASPDQYTYTLSTLDGTFAERTWALHAPATGTITRSAFNLSDTCLTALESSLCIAANGDANATLATITPEHMPLALLPGMTQDVEGEFGGSIGLRLVPGEPWTVIPDVSLSTSPLTIRQTTGDGESLALPVNPLQLTLATRSDGQWQMEAHITADERAPLALDADLTLRPDFAAFSGSAMTGSLHLQWPDIKPMAPFVRAYATQVSGRLALNTEIAGTLSAPEVTGTVSLKDAGAKLNQGGLELRKVSVDLSARHDATTGGQTLQLIAEATSGEGTLQLNAQATDVTTLTQLNAQGAITGSNVVVANTHETYVVASPDLKVALTERKLTLTGNMTLPKARIRIDSLPESAITVTDDQVIHAELASDRETTPLDVAAEVRLNLGDDVRFEGMGLKTQLTGTLAIEQTGARVLGRGTIATKDGTYKAYGQNLAINTGKLIWADSPIDAPGIELDASRQPRPDVKVGILARGPLSQPTTRLYSEPDMPESDRLSYLVLGRPMQDNSEQESSVLNQAALALGIKGSEFLTTRIGEGLGLDQFGVAAPAGAGNDQASFVIGKYLTPSLYVSYGVGLLDAVSTLRLEYILSSRWRLVTESATEHSGGDLLYTVERK